MSRLITKIPNGWLLRRFLRVWGLDDQRILGQIVGLIRTLVCDDTALVKRSTVSFIFRLTPLAAPCVATGERSMTLIL